jgi:DNA-binding NarL/FixJ family response regulator
MDADCPITVLLADSSEEIRTRIKAALRETHMHVVGECRSVDECVYAILRTWPDVVVLDVALQDGTGLQVLHRVETVGVKVRFVVYTNRTERQYRERYLAAGATAFLDKSAGFEQLRAAIAASGIRGREY